MIFFTIESPNPDPVGFVLNIKIEDLGEMLLRDPHPVILDDDEDIFLRSPGEKMDLPLFRDRLNAVDEKVRNRQVELTDVDLTKGSFSENGFSILAFFIWASVVRGEPLSRALHSIGSIQISGVGDG